MLGAFLFTLLFLHLYAALHVEDEKHGGYGLPLFDGLPLKAQARLVANIGMRLIQDAPPELGKVLAQRGGRIEHLVKLLERDHHVRPVRP